MKDYNHPKYKIKRLRSWMGFWLIMFALLLMSNLFEWLGAIFK